MTSPSAGPLALGPTLKAMYMRPSAMERHRLAPLLAERESYLAHRVREGYGPKAVMSEAGALLQVVRGLGMDELRPIRMEEIEAAGDVWVTTSASRIRGRSGPTSKTQFMTAARLFLKFHGFLEPSSVPYPFHRELSRGAARFHDGHHSFAQGKHRALPQMDRTSTAPCAIDGLRASEVANLRLSSVNWQEETLTVRRSKNHRTQQFPLQHEVGRAILRYLAEDRPRSPSQALFLTITRPHRPIAPYHVTTVAKWSLPKLGIDGCRLGAHCLRHAAATQLLCSGSSLKEIADFLGHDGVRTVSTYARHDIESLCDARSEWWG